MKKEIPLGQSREVVEEMAEKIEQTLNAFDVPIKVVKAIEGLHSYHFHLKTLKPVRMKAIESFEQDLRYALGSSKVEIQAPIPDEVLIGISVPKSDSIPMLLWSDAVEAEEFADSGYLVVPLGQDEFGEEVNLKIPRLPHVLIGGATGSGKTVLLYSIINSLMLKHSPDEVRFIFADPKRWSLVQYNGIPHLLTPVITDAKRVILALKHCIKEMERRLDIFLENRILNISSYHTSIYQPAIEKFKKRGSREDERDDLPEPLPYIVIVLDELSDLMAAYPKELEACIVRLAQKSRTVGIHLILSTQRPSVNVVTGLMKANIPTRIAFQVTSSIDSRTILDQSGAEKLLGNGDMLYINAEMLQPARIQGYYISDEEMLKNIELIRMKYDMPELDSIQFSNNNSTNGAFFSNDEEDEDDDLYEDVKAVVVETGKASTSFLQRKFGIGYSRSAKLIDLLEERGVIGPSNGSEPRKVLIPKEED